MYCVKELYDGIYQDLGVPIVFDIHHHNFNTGNMNHNEAMKLAMSTWPKGIRPVVHYSESKAIHENDNKIKLQAHSNYINDIIQTYDNDVDVMIDVLFHLNLKFELEMEMDGNGLHFARD